ncbi:MAG: antibiotic biosynthesis monooxygenase [Acidobacteriota bacterium]|nr:antibiotic biosynthesis monooxygenase [Acidobacteriota bacterium]
MADRTLRVVVRMIARPDKVEEVRSLLTNIIEPSRQEVGCISYELLHNRNDPTDLTAIEEWENEAAYQGHLASPHVQEVLARFADLTIGAPDIRHYTVVG